MANDTPQKLGAALMVGGVAFIGYQLLIKPADDKNKQLAEEAKADTNPNTQQALTLRAALDPTFLMFNGTNISVVQSTATKISDLTAVTVAYQSLTGGRGLQTDLEHCLSANEYEAFMNQVKGNTKTIVNSKGIITTATQPFVPGKIIFAKVNLNLRSTPIIQGSTDIIARALFSFSEILGKANLATTNIVGLLKPGEFVGYFTGNQRVDQANNTKFIEVAYQVNGKHASCPAALKSKDGQLIKYWVSASSDLITTYRFYADVDRAYGGTSSYPTQMLWKLKPASIALSGLGSLRQLASKTLYTTSAAMIYDDNMRSTIQVRKGTVLGTRQLSVKNPSGRSYHQYRTPEGKCFWVNSYATNQPE